jgi:hypothetical protein
MAENAPWETSADAPQETAPWDTAPWDTGSSPSTSWSDVAKGAATSFLPSAGQALKSTYEAFRHPIDTGTAAGRTLIGGLQKTGLVAGDEYKPYAEAVGQHFMENYGSMEGFKHSLATDPVGVLGDLSIALTGGGGAAVRAPAMLGRVGEVTRAVGRGAQVAGHYTNPFTPVVGAAKLAGAGLSEGLGLQSGVGGETVRTAAQAGYEGGDAAKDFREHLRGTAEMADPVDDARDALKNIRQERGKEYTDRMAEIGQDTTPLDFKDIDDAFARASGVRQFKGVDIDPSTAKLREQIGNTLTNWRNLDPAEYHTAEGLDALKKQVGSILKAQEPYSPESKMAGEVYNAIKQTIIKQNPKYGKVMQAYDAASDQIDELERTLSLKDSATADTALRKLQAILRNNVNTNYGYRRTLAEYLMRAGSPTLMQKLAGQALNSPTPRGLGKFALQIGGEIAALGGAAWFAHPAFAAMAPMIAMSSPRVVGEAAYYAGRAASPLKYIPGGATATAATTARGLEPYLDASRHPVVAGDQQQQPAPPTKTADVRGALPVTGSEVGQAGVSGAGGILKSAAIKTTGVGGSRDDIAKHYANYQRFPAMSPEEQHGALTALHSDTNISILERRRLEKMMMEQRPLGVPQGSRRERSSSGLTRWIAPDGSVYSPGGQNVGRLQ